MTPCDITAYFYATVLCRFNKQSKICELLSLTGAGRLILSPLVEQSLARCFPL